MSKQTRHLSFTVPELPEGIDDLHIECDHEPLEYDIIGDAGKDLIAIQNGAVLDITSLESPDGKIKKWSEGDVIRVKFVFDGNPNVDISWNWTKGGQSV